MNWFQKWWLALPVREKQIFVLGLLSVFWVAYFLLRGRDPVESVAIVVLMQSVGFACYMAFLRQYFE